MTDPYRYFRIEARELVDEFTQIVLASEKDGTAPQSLTALLRIAHTLKGAARVVKHSQIAELAHQVEDILAPYRESDTGVPGSRDIDALLAFAQSIRTHLAALGSVVAGSADPLPGPSPTSGDAMHTRGVTPVPPAAHAFPSRSPAPPVQPKTTADDVDKLLESVGAAAAGLASLRDSAGTRERVRRVLARLKEHALASTLADCVTELSKVETALQRDADGIAAVARELSGTREAAERLRLLPAGLMFVSLEVMARDAARHTVHDPAAIDFVALGGDVRLDAEVFAGVQHAMVQAVRNAVAHGIESQADRLAAGKPARRRIAVEVRQLDRKAAFICHDDGRGIDVEAVRRKLATRGMAADAAAAMDRDAVLQALLGGGVSTAASLTQHAGRGIGLDVVRDTAVRLRGEVTLESEPGAGTTITLTVPVSIAAFRALIVDDGTARVAIPLAAVRQALRIDAAQLIHSAEGASILYEGAILPFAPLQRALRNTARPAATGRAWSTVVVRGANALGANALGANALGATALAAIGVEGLLGTENLVIRPLPAYTPCDAVVAGASLAADGRPQLVLDPDALVAFALKAGSTPARAIPDAAPVLVIDDSLTTRMLEQSILESAGYDVDVAICAEDGLTRARQRAYALFLVDVEMPGMDGFTFIEQIRADAGLKHIPAILVTSRAEPEDFERGRRVGAQDYIVKGEFDQGRLLTRIRELVGAR